jgi:hypothetical protein
MSHLASRISCAALTALALFPAGVLAAPMAYGTPQAYVPRVPVSALARPMAWFDPSRIRVSSTTSFGSSLGGGVSALQTTSFSYRFEAPVWMRVSLGNAWSDRTAGSQNSFFLQGLDLAYRPSPSTIFEFRYQSLRSPLQFAPDARGFWAP